MNWSPEVPTCVVLRSRQTSDRLVGSDSITRMPKLPGRYCVATSKVFTKAPETERVIFMIATPLPPRLFLSMISSRGSILERGREVCRA